MANVQVSQSSLPPVSIEQAFLETYFHALSQFAYDKAKEVAEKDRDSRKTNYGSTWTSLLNSLSHLAMAEKMYASLGYLGQKKWFSGRESLRSTYSSLLTELRKIEDTGRQAVGGTAPSLEKLLAHLCGQLSSFVAARLETMDFYETLCSMGSSRVIGYAEVAVNLAAIIQRHSKSFHHPILTPLKTSFSDELSILYHLLQAQADMAVWCFLPALLHLHEAHSKLNSWGAIVQMAKEQSQKKGFELFGSTSTKVPQVPPLHQWLLSFKAALVSKFSLYFNETLSKQSSPPEMKTLLAKTSCDYMAKFATFLRKSDATNLSIVLDTRGLEETYKGHGYHHPAAKLEPPKGLDSYPAIVSVPGERPQHHWPNLIMIMNNNAAEMNTMERIVYFYDKAFQSTYYMIRIEPKMTLVVIFETKRAEKDSYVNTFLTEISSQLKNNKLLLNLKPGSK
ncbi:PREDICTED: UPF0536 protein C12orf66 homolog isoform X1 [Branchiostoma belcheri]|uniref:KICSTOR subunit 2 n=1 Tax=Branchiostoma belcheri TaxID=7741 RepID=A0A6P5ANS0_BRABE|nr:PREDICTED: UPF0536 protein C12orf66 homolog isoform X1 [Branchiostoma belcheri]KAI8518613.1 hypothetical protein Bbelb_046300 [Branchiostoma belcheri]